jgi:hypothetical protein
LSRTYGGPDFLCDFSHRFRGGLTYAAPTALVCRFSSCVEFVSYRRYVCCRREKNEHAKKENAGKNERAEKLNERLMHWCVEGGH